MQVKELARKYYPQYWNVNKLVNLVKAGKLTGAEYKEVTGFTYPKVK